MVFLVDAFPGEFHLTLVYEICFNEQLKVSGAVHQQNLFGFFNLSEVIGMLHDTLDSQGCQCLSGAVHDKVFSLEQLSFSYKHLIEHPINPTLKLTDQTGFLFSEQSTDIQAMLFKTIKEWRIHLSKFILIYVDQAVERRMHKTLGIVVGTYTDSAEVTIAHSMERFVEEIVQGSLNVVVDIFEYQ